MSVEADYSVRPIENEGIIPVDGPVVESSAPSFDSHSSFSEAESSDMSEHSTSSSSINSPKSGLDGGSSETSFEEGEITKIKLERPEDAKHEAVEAGNEVTESGDKLDVEPEVKGANGKSQKLTQSCSLIFQKWPLSTKVLRKFSTARITVLKKLSILQRMQRLYRSSRSSLSKTSLSRLSMNSPLTSRSRRRWHIPILRQVIPGTTPLRPMTNPRTPLLSRPSHIQHLVACRPTYAPEFNPQSRVMLDSKSPR